jgi:hypothetical protein
MKARYHLFGTKEESIAYDILTAHAKSYTNDVGNKISAIIHNFKTPEDRVNAIEMLIKALKPIMKFDKYKAMPCSEQRVIDTRLFQALVSSTSSKLSVAQEVTRRWARAEDERSGYAYNTIDFTVNCKNGDAKNEDAINALTNLIYPILYHNYRQLCYTNASAPLTLMCVKKYHANSLFGRLPKDIALVIAKEVKAGNKKLYKM